MKEFKEYQYFFFTDYEEEAEYLSYMNSKGYYFTYRSFGGMIYHFIEGTPCEMVYQIDYNPKALKRKDDYLQIYSDCGWEKVYSKKGYTYFRKPLALMKSEEEIYCDPESRLEMLRRIIWTRMPIILIFLLIVIPINIITSVNSDGLFSTGTFTGIVLLIAYLIMFIKVILKYKKLKEKVQK